jgi:hypothetical protein
VQAALARADGAKTRETDAVRAAGVKTAVIDRTGAARDGVVGSAQATSGRIGSATTNVRATVADRAGAARRAAAWVVLPLLSSSALAWHDVAAAARGAARRPLRRRLARHLRGRGGDCAGRCRGGPMPRRAASRRQVRGRARAHALAHAHTRTRQPSPSCRLPTPLSTLATGVARVRFIVAVRAAKRSPWSVWFCRL